MQLQLQPGRKQLICRRLGFILRPVEFIEEFKQLWPDLHSEKPFWQHGG